MGNITTLCCFITILLCIESTRTSPAIKVRLAGDNRPHNAGRLEIYYNNTWGTVCDDGFGNRDARVACYMLGFGRLGSFVRNYYGTGSGQIWLDDVQCTGNELSLAACRRHSWGANNCHHGEDVSINCDNSNCSTSHPGCDVVLKTNVHNLYKQLLNGTLCKYRLQSFCVAWHNCSKYLQRNGCTITGLLTRPNVVKYSAWRQFRVSRVTQQRYNKVADFMHHLCSDIEARDEIYRPCYQSALYNALHEVCGYTINSYSRPCSFLQSRKYCYARKILENCNKSATDVNMLKMVIYGAWVMRIVDSSCKVNIDQLIGNNADLNAIVHSMSSVTVRLAGENSLPNAGRLEIYYNNSWGTVCNDGFGDEDAQVACYMLGFGRSGLSFYNHHVKDSGPIWLDDLFCTGYELSLAECGHRGWGNHNCGHYEDVSIICDNSNCSTSHPDCDVV